MISDFGLVENHIHVDTKTTNSQNTQNFNFCACAMTSSFGAVVELSRTSIDPVHIHVTKNVMYLLCFKLMISRGDTIYMSKLRTKALSRNAFNQNRPRIHVCHFVHFSSTFPCSALWSGGEVAVIIEISFESFQKQILQFLRGEKVLQRFFPNHPVYRYIKNTSSPTLQ